MNERGCWLSRLIAIACVASASASACASSDSVSSAQREPIGKADLFGSCAGTNCDGPSLDGNCYCDSQCSAVGDCCADYAAVCSGGCDNFAFEFLARAAGGGAEVDVIARGAPPATDQLLGKLTSLTYEFKPQRIAIPTALATSGQLILKVSGNNAYIGRQTFTRDGVMYYAFQFWEDLQPGPSYFWAPAPACRGANDLVPNTLQTFTIANQMTFRVEPPQFKNAFLSARVTDTSCATGPGLVDTGQVNVFFVQDGNPSKLVRDAQVIRHQNVLNNTQLNSEPGKPGMLWVTSSTSLTFSPDVNDGNCEVELLLDYR